MRTLSPDLALELLRDAKERPFFPKIIRFYLSWEAWMKPHPNHGPSHKDGLIIQVLLGESGIVFVWFPEQEIGCFLPLPAPSFHHCVKFQTSIVVLERWFEMMLATLGFSFFFFGVCDRGVFRKTHAHYFFGGVYESLRWMPVLSWMKGKEV